MVVLLPADQLQHIVSHARRTYPEECCGVLIGVDSGHRIIQRVLAMPNTARTQRVRHYRIDSSDLVYAHAEARQYGLQLMGAYHSHPDAPVEPSQFDLHYAWPNFTYIVISLEEGEPLDVGAWLLNQESTGFVLDELRVY